MHHIARLLMIMSAAALTGESTPIPADCDLTFVGLTDDQRLVRFKACRPGRVVELGFVNGLQGLDATLIGIDHRVQDGLLYGVGNAGGIYTIDTGTASASLVSQLTVPLDGTSFGVDFNPAADRLRIISDTGQNLRHNVNPGGITIADLALNYTAGTTAAGVVGAAYTNNDLDAATGTTLFDLDGAMDQIVIQAPPNNGSLTATGKLGLDAGAIAGFDIFTKVDDAGRVLRNDGYAAIVSTGTNGFYRVNLLTGEARSAGALNDTVVDIAVRPAR
ncbi:MAG: DUF4394 domain-containing protein [Candidatus Polarisedimenticolia bacterium]